MNTKMSCKSRPCGSAMILTVFILALAAALVIGMLQLNTEQTMQMRNQIELARACAIAEAGLNDAMYELRRDIHWSAGFVNKSFPDGRYTVTVSGTVPALTIVSTGRTSHDYFARLEADVIVGAADPHTIQIQALRINE